MIMHGQAPMTHDTLLRHVFVVTENVGPLNLGVVVNPSSTYSDDEDVRFAFKQIVNVS